MPNPQAAINPRLISVITGQDLKTVKEQPTLAMLPGQYANLVYFRCKHCNGAGKWEIASTFTYLGIIGKILIGKQSNTGGFAAGELRLFDGSIPRWVSDGEDRFLDRLQEAGHDGYLWNGVGSFERIGKSGNTTPCDPRTYLSRSGISSG